MKKMTWRESLALIAMAVILALALFVVPGSAAELHVGADQQYKSIQAAINAADTVNNTIIVHNGTYKENLVVNKSNIVIRSDNGSSVTTISSNTTDKHVVNITDQTNVTLEGFTIRDAHGTNKLVAGIYLNNASECTISNNTVTNISTTGFQTAYGIYLYYSSNNTFNSSTSVSTITGTPAAYGIYLFYSSNNRFSASTSVSTISGVLSASGIYLYYSCNSNTFSSSTSVSTITGKDSAYGIFLIWNSNNNTFSSSTSVSTVSATNRAYGIYLYYSCNNNTFSSSTSVSTVSATNRAYGIFLASSCNNNTFSSSTSVSTITANQTACGIELFESSKNTFSANTSVSTISANLNAYGIALESDEYNSDDNTFTGVTIAPTITGAESYEFWSDENCADNVVTDLTIGNPTTISFTYGNGIWIKRVNVSERPGDPGNYRNISKYINASNITTNSWLFVNFSYSQNDVYDAGITEGTLTVWKYNDTAWNEDGWSESRVLDTTNNVVGVNITRFCIFAPLGIPVTSVTIPTATGTGNATITTSSGYFCDVTALTASDLPSVPDSALTFTHGLFNLSICGLNDTNPENVTINFAFPSAIPTDAEFWKYNASNGTWYPYPFDDNDGDNVISITITDNGAGDHNPANGTITDPGGIGWRQPVAPVPTMTPVGLVALMGLLSAVATLTIRKR
jgi:nitrous oxidase accessory protein